MAGANCGFASFAATVELMPGIVWAKFEALSEGGRRASQRLWVDELARPYRGLALRGGVWHLCAVSIRLRDVLMRELGELRYEPVEKRIRATLAGLQVVDSKRAMLVWEPRRVVPSYAVPIDDIDGGLSAAGEASDDSGAGAIEAPLLEGRPVFDPSIPFGVHTTHGEPLVLSADAGEREAAAFRPFDDALAGYVILDFDGFDAWFEEPSCHVARRILSAPTGASVVLVAGGRGPHRLGATRRRYARRRR